MISLISFRVVQLKLSCGMDFTSARRHIVNSQVYQLISVISVERIHFTKELEDTKVKEVGKLATLVCEISKDGLKVDWYHGNTKIRRGEEYDVVADGKTHKLVIEKVTDDIVGEYRAEYKTASTICQLSLAGKKTCDSIINEVAGEPLLHLLDMTSYKMLRCNVTLLPLVHPE